MEKKHTKHIIVKYTCKHEIKSYAIRSNKNIEILNNCIICSGQQQINVFQNITINGHLNNTLITQKDYA